MGVFFSSRKPCYCAFCRTERKVYVKRNIVWADIAGAALGAGVVMMAIWQEFDPRVSLIFVFFLAIAECFVQFRWRMTIACPHCGFDPVLYTKNPNLAAQKVKAKLDRRKEDPAAVLARPLHLTRISKERKEHLEKVESGQKGSLVSRQI